MTVSITTGSAITLLNAIATGYGSAVGIDVTSNVTIKKSDTMNFKISPGENDDRLIRSCISVFSEYTGIVVDEIYLETTSDLPPSRGLKTSSAISTGCIAALSVFYEADLETHEIIHLGAKASVDCGVSITGAIDDAYASFVGDGHLTNNTDMIHLQTFSLPDYQVYLLIPQDKLPKSEIGNLSSIVNKQKLFDAKDAVVNGDYIKAIELNTEVYADLLLEDPSIISHIKKYWKNDILCVGLNGAGPSLFLLADSEVEENRIDHFLKEFNTYSILHTKLRRS